MVMRWSKFFIERYRITILIMVLIIIGGISGYTGLPQQINPPGIDIGLAVVNTTYPGASAGEMEDEVTEPLEEAFENLENVKEITSGSSNSFSSIMVRFEEGSDGDKNMEGLKAELDKVVLPPDAEEPVVIEPKANEFAAWQISVAGDYSRAQLAGFAEAIKDELRPISGIKSIEIMGGASEEIAVEMDKRSMEEKGLSLSEVAQAIGANNISFPGGELDTGDYEFDVVNESALGGVDDLKDLVVGYSATGGIRLEDIADITAREVGGETSQRTGWREGGGLEAGDSVTINIYKAEGINVRAADEEVAAALEQAAEDLPDDVAVDVIWRDADQVESILGELTSSAWQGLIIVIVVLMLFISVRSGILIGLLIPLIFLSVFMLFGIFGFTLNMVTMFSLVLVLGMLVDNSIVIVESIQHNLDRGLERKKAVLNAVRGVGPAVIAATVTTLIVFIPVGMITGVVGQFVEEMPWTVLFALGSSLFLAFTLTPLLGYLFMKPGRKRRGRKRGEVNYGRAVTGYHKFITAVLGKGWRRALVIILALALFSVSAWLPLSGTLKAVQFPEGDAEMVYLALNMPRDSSRAEVDAAMLKIEEALLSGREIENFSLERGELSGAGMVFLTPIGERSATSAEILDELEDKFDRIDTEGRIFASAIGMGPPEEEYNIHFRVMGDDIAGLERAAPEIAGWLEGKEGVKCVDDGVSDTGRRLEIEYDREKIAENGLSNAIIASQVRDMLQGVEAGALGDDKIIVRFKDEDRDEIADLENLEIETPLGRKAALKDLAEVVETRAVNSISHRDGRRYVEVQAYADLDSDRLGEINNEAAEEFTPERLEELGLEGGRVETGGLYDEMMDAYGNLTQALVLAVILVYLVLIAQFRSFMQPFIILMALPLALIGVFPSLWAFGEVVSFMAFVGIIALLGVVVNDSIVLIDQVNRLRREGKDLLEAAAKGAMARFKPIIATTLTTCGGLVPITVTNPFWRGVGITIIGGLLFATTLTLIVIPAIYVALEALKSRIKKSIHARPARGRQDPQDRPGKGRRERA